MLPLHRYPFEVLKKRPLTAEMTGVAPWECQWILEQVDKVQGHVLEIGTHLGVTAREIALAFPSRQLFCVDCCAPEYGLKQEEICRGAKDLPNVTLTLMDSKSYEIPKGVGIIFIDGDHSWEGVKADTENAFKHFRTHTGIIIWHDYCQEFEVMPYLEWIREKQRLDIKHVQDTTLAFLHL